MVTSAVTNWPGGRVGHPCVGRLVYGLVDGTALGDLAPDRVGHIQLSTYATHRCTFHLYVRWGLIEAYRRNGSPIYTTKATLWSIPPPEDYQNQFSCNMTSFGSRI